MSKHPPAPPAPVRGHRVRELVCAYRPLRSRDGRVIDVPTLDLGNARIAASVFTQLLAGEPVEVFGVACLSTSIVCSLGTCCRVGHAPARLSQCRMCSCPRV